MGCFANPPCKLIQRCGERGIDKCVFVQWWRRKEGGKVFNAFSQPRFIYVEAEEERKNARWNFPSFLTKDEIWEM